MLGRKIFGVKLDNNDSVSEDFQPGKEMANIRCRNVLADHPSWTESSGQGEEVSGEVGMAARSGAFSERPRLARISATEEKRGRRFGRDGIDFAHIVEFLDPRPFPFEELPAAAVRLDLEDDPEPRRLEAAVESADPGKDRDDIMPHFSSSNLNCPSSSARCCFFRAARWTRVWMARFFMVMQVCSSSSAVSIRNTPVAPEPMGIP